MNLFNIPNLLTLSRLILTIVIIFILFYRPLFTNEILRIFWVITLYIIAALTDYYDGHFARKLKERTEFGSFMDSLVDKIFVLSIFYSFLFIRSIEIHPAWIWIILVREVIVTVFRIIFLLKRRPMVTEKHGKVKTTLQITTQSFILAIMLIYSITYETTLFKNFSQQAGIFIWEIPSIEFKLFFLSQYTWIKNTFDLVSLLPNALTFAVAAYTAYSGLTYFIKNRANF